LIGLYDFISTKVAYVSIEFLLHGVTRKLHVDESPPDHFYRL